MYLNNNQFKHGLYNGSIVIIINIFNQENVEVAFPLNDGIKIFHVKKDHKTQSLICNTIIVWIYFCSRTSIVAMSKAPSWEKLQITSFNINAIKTDQHVLKEYGRLQNKYKKI